MLSTKRAYNYGPLLEFLETETAPRELADALERLNARYIQYLLREDSQYTDAADHVYYLRMLYQAIAALETPPEPE